MLPLLRRITAWVGRTHATAARSGRRGRRRRRRRLEFDQLETRLVLNAPSTGWNLVFVDEFDGTAIDQTKWTTRLPWPGDDGSYRHHNGNYLSYIMDDDVVVSGGTLKLRTQHRRVYNPSGRPYDYTE